MYLRDNPVLQRELLVNLRTLRAFVLLFVFVAGLGAVVYAAWPASQRLDLTDPQAAKTLVNIFFLGQYVLASMMAPSFAAGAITSEKEHKSYEALLASPLKPQAIVLGKLFASLAHLGILVFTSLPIVMLCLPLGGVSFYEVLAAYVALILAVLVFGMVSLACSSYFQRTASSLVVSYLLVLPMAIIGVLLWQAFEGAAETRLVAAFTFLPATAFVVVGVLFSTTSRRLLHPPDVGSEGREVVDEQLDQQQTVGLVIQRDQFPDRLFAPPKRTELLADNANPVFDKEMRSELFSQGTLMLRVVIQVSLALAVPFMAVCLFLYPSQSAWYISYVVLFNMLVGPVFSAGTVTSERERETLDLLLVTTVSPWQILWGKLVASMRVSSVLTSFLLWPMVLACVFVTTFWHNIPTVIGFLVIVLLTSVTTCEIAMMCSIFFRRTSVSMMVSYLIIVILFCGPVAVDVFMRTFYGGGQVSGVGFLSPLSAAFSLPVNDALDDMSNVPQVHTGVPAVWYAFAASYIALDAFLVGAMVWLFNTRWRVAQ